MKKPIREGLRLALPALFVVAFCQTAVVAQMIDDAVMVRAGTVFGGYLYTHDSWSQYWEGPLLRSNGNIGTLTTQTDTIYLDYGLTDRINLMADIPHVRTDASQGVLDGQSGWQDLKIAAKLRLPTVHVGGFGSLSSFIVPFFTAVMTDYSPDFQPMSIGLGSPQRGVRVTENFQLHSGWCLNASGAYTYQRPVTLDRPYYFTNNQLFLTDAVNMPDVVDYSISPGWARKDRMAQFTYSKLLTQGGADVGDIRRQDSPFVANRFIATRVGGSAMIPVPKVSGVDLWVAYSYVVDGRNVGQSNTFTIGIFRTQSIRKRAKVK